MTAPLKKLACNLRKHKIVYLMFIPVFAYYALFTDEYSLGTLKRDSKRMIDVSCSPFCVLSIKILLYRFCSLFRGLRDIPGNLSLGSSNNTFPVPLYYKRDC